MTTVWSKPIKCGRCGKVLLDSDETTAHVREHLEADKLDDAQHDLLWPPVEPK